MKICARPTPAPATKKSLQSLPAGPAVIETSDQVDCDLTRPAAQAALTRSLAMIAAHQVQQVSSSLAGLPATELMFHGTSSAFDRLEPRPNQRTGFNGEIEWSGTAIFAAMDPRVGLFYTAQRSPEVSTAVSLRSYTAPDQPLDISLRGGTSLEDALNHAYGDPERPDSCLGYLHILDRSPFVHEKGLGCMEKVTRDSNADLGQLVLNRRAALKELQEQGLVRLNWVPRV